ncbi:MAG: pseudouridine synthase [Candidatus Saccharibacteria bacterium]|nr:pseudouridine synthase [Candidatus Saccharibacteria bacterium]
MPKTSSSSDSNLLRLNKFLATHSGLSRREADEKIMRKKVLVNGRPAKLGDRIGDNDEIKLDGKIISHSDRYLYLALNKPVGYVCSRHQQGTAPTIYSLLPKNLQHLKTVGRLDRDSEGLILFTNDGDFNYQMTHPKFHKLKVYEVELDKDLAPLHQQSISDFGIQLPDGPSRLILTKLTSSRHFRVEMSEGRNRQIRRTFLALGYTVTSLKRLAFGPYRLNNLPLGKYEFIPKILRA